MHLQVSKHQVLNARLDKWLVQMEVEIEITFPEFLATFANKKVSCNSCSVKIILAVF